MKRLWAVLKREYLAAVKKKSFLIVTLLGPFFFAALIFIPALLATRGLGDRRIVVVDGTGRLSKAFDDPGATKPPSRRERGDGLRTRPPSFGRLDVKVVDASAEADPKAAAEPYLARLRERQKGSEKLDGILVVPRGAMEASDARMAYYSRSSADVMTRERLGRVVSRALSRQRLSARGIDPAEVDALVRDVPVDGVQVTAEGEKKGGDVDTTLLFAFVFVGLLFIPVLLYGQEIMRGIIQEKNDRIVEILVSSMSPFELLSGKVLGMAAVGLTQLAAWMAMGAAMVGFAVASGPGGSLPLGTFLRPAVAWAFLVFYVLGYMIYVCVYAVGGAVVNTEKEAQNLLTPIILILMVPWFLLMAIVMSPESTLSVVLSFVPIYTPITMFIRVLVSQPPAWQVVLSVVLSLATIVGMFWLTAKVFRTGILSYGKRPTIPELWRWMREA